MFTVEPGFRRLAPLVWAALAATTLVNTTLPLVAPVLGLEPPAAGQLRDWILILHAALGLLASWSIALALASRAAGAAGAGLVFALIEKGAELVGQILVVFTVHRGWQQQLVHTADPVEKRAIEARIDLFADLWDDTFLVFWIGALLSNLFWLLAARHVDVRRRGLSLAFLVMALLALALILESYGGLASIGAWLPLAYPVLLTGSRVWVAWWLWQRDS